MSYTTLERFLPAINTLPTDKPLTKQHLLIGMFSMENDGDLEMYYAPHNEYINKKAKVVIVGITPGWSQMKIAFQQFTKSLATDAHLETCLYDAKVAAGFAGSMRSNLLEMLNQCDIPKNFNLPNASYLFEQNRELLHTTSIIKYPVFLNGKNYTGHQPPIHRSALLQHYVDDIFPNELAQITSPALVIPLGKTVEHVMLRLVSKNKLPDHVYLTGFPHPSGANGHRIKQFQQQRHQLRERVSAWSNMKK